MSKYHQKSSIVEESAGAPEERERRVSGAAPDARDLAAFLPYACRQLQASFSVKVTPHYQDASRQHKPSSTLARSSSLSAASRTASLPPDEELPLAAALDAAGALVALAARRAALPCLLLKLLALAAPHQPRLARLTLRACRLDARAFHQLCSLLLASSITELGLDDSPLRVGGYHLLLQHPSHLTCLSLDRCSLGDDGVAAIADELQYPRPAARSLRVLSLAGNGVGNAGARALAAALRSNRGLQHLNLADNRISDAGATAVFNSLAEFELTKEEILEARRRTMDWLRQRQSVFARVLSELQAERARPRPSAVTLASARARGRPRPAAAAAVSSAALCAESLAARAEAATEQLMGPRAEPFSADHTTRTTGKVFCEGNLTLRWLDFAYNGLGQASLESLRDVLSYQAARRPPAPQPARAGLLRVGLQGAPLPDSEELYLVSSLLEEALERAAPRPARDRRHTAVGVGAKMKGRK